MTGGDTSAETAAPDRRWWVTVLLWLLLAVAAVFLLRLLRRIDWGQVLDAVGRLTWWEAGVLLLVLAVRIALAATPLALLVAGLSLPRAVANDLAGTTMANVTPAPADIVLRGAMFNSWGIDVPKGLAGLVLNSLLYYAVRIAAPVLGFLLLLLTYGVDDTLVWPALAGLVGAAVIVAGLWVGLRSSTGAATAGRALARGARRVRPSWQGADDLEQQVTEFQGNVADQVGPRALPTAAALLATVVVDGVIFLLAARFVGVPASAAPALLILGCFLSAYPMTALPFLGIGVLDAAVVALVADRSTADPDLLVAAMVVWRVCVQLVPLALGGLVIAWWRSHAGAVAASADEPA